MSLSRRKWGKDRPTMPSRFLFELTGQTQSPNYHKAVAYRGQTLKHRYQSSGKPNGSRSLKSSRD